MKKKLKAGDTLYPVVGRLFVEPIKIDKVDDDYAYYGECKFAIESIDGYVFPKFQTDTCYYLVVPQTEKVNQFKGEF